jgi:Skp family chaperone for outer membrane proteins
MLPVPQAAAQKTQNIAFLDMRRILSESLAMQDIVAQMKVLDDKLRAEGAQREKALREEREEILRQRVILSPDAFKAKQAEFQKKADSYQSEMQSRLRQLHVSRETAIRKVEKAMEPVVSDIANNAGATMIVEKEQILFGERDLELTDQIIKDLNSKLKKVTVSLVPLKQK